MSATCRGLDGRTSLLSLCPAGCPSSLSPPGAPSARKALPRDLPTPGPCQAPSFRDKPGWHRLAYQSLGPCPFQPGSHESRSHLQWSLQGPSAPHGGDTCSQKGSDLRLRPRSEKTYPDKGLQTSSLTQKSGQTCAFLLLRSPTKTTAEGSEEGKNPQDRIGLEGRPTGGGNHIPVGGHRVGRAGESAPSCMVEAAETGMPQLPSPSLPTLIPTISPCFIAPVCPH